MVPPAFDDDLGIAQRRTPKTLAAAISRKVEKPIFSQRIRVIQMPSRILGLAQLTTGLIAVKNGTISRTVCEDGKHRGNKDDRSVRTFALKPAPSALRNAALGLDCSARPSNPSAHTADAYL